MSFGSTPVAIPTLIDAINSDCLLRIPNHARTSLTQTALEKLGKSRGYTVFVSEPGRQIDRPEWLLDLVWWEPGKGSVLAVECEWGDAGEILHGFRKLMATKAPLKLMIFRSRRAGAEKQDILFRTDREAILQVLGTSLLDFSEHVEGETYLLLEYVEAGPTFNMYEFRVPADGKLKTEFKDAATLFHRRELEKAIAA